MFGPFTAFNPSLLKKNDRQFEKVKKFENFFLKDAFYYSFSKKLDGFRLMARKIFKALKKKKKSYL